MEDYMDELMQAFRLAMQLTHQLGEPYRTQAKRIAELLARIIYSENPALYYGVIAYKHLQEFLDGKRKIQCTQDKYWVKSKQCKDLPDGSVQLGDTRCGLRLSVSWEGSWIRILHIPQKLGLSRPQCWILRSTT